MPPELSLVIPTFNERENLPVLVRQIHKILSPRLGYELIIVDDNSPDGTGELAERLSKDYPIRVIHRTERRDRAPAVVNGFGAAKGKLIAVIDADLQHPPELLLDMVDKTSQGSDIVVGSRYVGGGGIKGWPFYRKFISKGAALLSHVLLPKTRNVEGPTSGFFVMKREVIEDIEINPLGSEVLIEILAKGNYNKVSKVPYTFKPRTRGKSKLSGKEMARYISHVYSILRDTKEDVRFTKFCVVGVSGIGVNTGLLWLLTEFGGLYYMVSAIVGAETSILTNYYLNEIWTFRDRAKDSSFKARLKRAFTYNWTRIMGMGIGLFVLFCLTEFLGIHYLISNLVAIATGVAWGFLTSTHWVWPISSSGENTIVSVPIKDDR
jgi:dolichol-phosphate mannosyltransferase